MKTIAVAFTVLVTLAIAPILTLLLGGCCDMAPSINVEQERAEITKVIHASIGWAANKDTTLLFNAMAHDDELFWFSPRDDGTMHGYKAFVEMTESVFMQDEFKAIRYEVKDLYVGISPLGDAAWWHARLDDFNEWAGQPANWVDVRWTGVLVKRDGRWVIVQQHFSSPTDRKPAEPKAEG